MSNICGWQSRQEEDLESLIASMAKGPLRKTSQPTSPKRRKSLTSDQPKKDKGRSRNACDRCKQKKVKCDGEGVQTCSICREGDFRCHYATKALSEKSQFRKGYVEMVEEANEYYKSGIHRMYEIFKDSPVFSELSQRRVEGHPTAQEIAQAAGVPSTDKPHEGGIESINAYLEAQNKPLIVRDGEWDKVESPNGEQYPRSASSTMPSSPEASPQIDQRNLHTFSSTSTSSVFAPLTPNSTFAYPGEAPKMMSQVQESTNGASPVGLQLFTREHSPLIPRSKQPSPSHENGYTGHASSVSPAVSVPARVSGHSVDMKMLQTRSEYLRPDMPQLGVSMSNRQSPIDAHAFQVMSMAPYGLLGGTTVHMSDLDLSSQQMANYGQPTAVTTSGTTHGLAAAHYVSADNLSQMSMVDTTEANETWQQQQHRNFAQAQHTAQMHQMGQRIPPMG